MRDAGAAIEMIEGEIGLACKRVGRDPAEVKLVAVSKNFPAERVLEVYNRGQRRFGENRVQELVKKRAALPEDIEWHMIGTLQRNKVKAIINKVALIHSVCSLPLAREISKHATAQNLEVPVLLQVNIAEEATKSGFQQHEILAAVKEICLLPGIKVRGLMTMAPIANDPEDVRPVFRRLKMLAQEIETLRFPGVEMKELSMGMSDDYIVAVEEGATYVRIGSRIFGPRN